MGNHKSAIKRHKQSVKRQTKNRSDRGTIRTAVKKVNELIADGKVQEAETAARTATKLLAKAGNKGLLHKANSNRSISRLNTRVAAAKSGKTATPVKKKATAKSKSK